jgi:hypothetical protein
VQLFKIVRHVNSSARAVMISSLVAMSLIDTIGAADISSSMPKRGVMFLRRAITPIMWCAAEPDASAFRQLDDIAGDPSHLVARQQRGRVVRFTPKSRHC